MSGMSVPRTVVTLATLGALTAATTEGRAAPNNWNQWDDDAASGVAQGTTRLGLGVDYALSGGSDHTVRLGFELEHMLRDHWGAVCAVALPVAGEWLAPLWVGLRLHVLPKQPFDPFLGAAGGVGWLAPDGLAAIAAPIATGRAGIAFHYFGLFFVQAEGGYDLAVYAREGVTMNVGGASFAGRLGVDF
jgi:hypothetical protein